MLKFPSIDKTPCGEGHWAHGPTVAVDPAHVIAVEPREHRYHTYRPGQAYSLLHLSQGGTIEVFAPADGVNAAFDRHYEQRIQARRDAVRRHP